MPIATTTPPALPCWRSRRPPLGFLVALSFAVLAPLAGPAAANERHFTFTYETAVLPQGGKELEVWTTPRLGREHRFYAAFDQRLEFEVGVTDRLMTAFYINFSGTNQTVIDPAGGTRARVASFDYGGVSSEWKLKLADPVADPLGFALYEEVLLAPDEVEFETKLLFDKQVGHLLLAANLVSEVELEMRTVGETEPELNFEADLAAGYQLRPGLWLGLEARSVNLLEDEELESSSIFAGPVFAYATKGWWAALTATPQIYAPKSESGHRDLIYQEAFTARILFSFHLE